VGKFNFGVGHRSPSQLFVDVLLAGLACAPTVAILFWWSDCGTKFVFGSWSWKSVLELERTIPFFTETYTSDTLSPFEFPVLAFVTGSAYLIFHLYLGGASVKNQTPVENLFTGLRRASDDHYLACLTGLVCMLFFVGGVVSSVGLQDEICNPSTHLRSWPWEAVEEGSMAYSSDAEKSYVVTKDAFSHISKALADRSTASLACLKGTYPEVGAIIPTSASVRSEGTSSGTLTRTVSFKRSLEFSTWKNPEWIEKVLYSGAGESNVRRCSTKTSEKKGDTTWTTTHYNQLCDDRDPAAWWSGKCAAQIPWNTQIGKISEIGFPWDMSSTSTAFFICTETWVSHVMTSLTCTMELQMEPSTGTILSGPSVSVHNIAWVRAVTSGTDDYRSDSHGRKARYADFSSFWEDLGMRNRRVGGSVGYTRAVVLHAQTSDDQFSSHSGRCLRATHGLRKDMSSLLNARFQSTWEGAFYTEPIISISPEFQDGAAKIVLEAAKIGLKSWLFG
jgi:hypothetical protein